MKTLPTGMPKSPSSPLGPAPISYHGGFQLTTWGGGGVLAEAGLHSPEAYRWEVGAQRSVAVWGLAQRPYSPLPLPSYPAPPPWLVGGMPVGTPRFGPGHMDVGPQLQQRFH